MNQNVLKQRIGRAREILYATGLDALYLTFPVSHRYFAGYDNPDGSICITRASAYLFADFRYVEAAKEQAGEAYEVVMPVTPRAEYLGKIFADEDVKRIGVEDRYMSCAAFAALRADFPDLSICAVDRRVEKLREVKTDDEIALIRQAQVIAEDALSAVIANFSREMTETDLAAELEYQMRKRGAEDKSFDTIAISGEATSRPHGVPQNRQLREGFLTLDFGATLDGYHSDMTRTFVIGEATDEMKELYDTVYRAQLAAIAEIKAGKTGIECDKVARDIIDEKYEGCFGHSLGHSVGLQIHEAPNLSMRAENVLEAGNVVTVEPGIYVEGKFGCRIEDMVVVTAEGCVNLTTFPKNLIEL